MHPQLATDRKRWREAIRVTAAQIAPPDYTYRGGERARDRGERERVGRDRGKEGYRDGGREGGRGSEREGGGEREGGRDGGRWGGGEGVI